MLKVNDNNYDDNDYDDDANKDDRSESNSQFFASSQT